MSAPSLRKRGDLDFHIPAGILQEMDKRPTSIGIFPVPGFALLSYASLVEPMRAANQLSGQELYRLIHFSDGPLVPSSGPAVVEAGTRLGEMPELDLFFVVAGGRPETFDDSKVLNWLGRLARRGVRMGGVSGGAVLLVKAGLMTGRRFTVHWEHADALAEMAPGLTIERSLFVVDRDRVTCAGGTASLDLMHALITAEHGASFARLVSDWFMQTETRPSGGPQRAGRAERLGTTATPVLAAVEAMESHLGDPLSLDQLAMIAQVSPRQLNRLFSHRLGQSTMAYYRGLRLALAHQLLTQSPMSLTEIALATGFASSSHFTTAYRARHGMAPSRVRDRGLQLPERRRTLLP